ncbi:bacteriohemerythrin [Magnetofaba australis]|nr:bacteriohemerythrin [Magnetofaba australis]
MPNLQMAHKILLGFLAPALILVIMGVWSHFVSSGVAEKTHTVRDVSFRLALLAAETKTNVVQVQQWLTDISATRGAEGFDDGYGEAENYAKLTLKNLDEFKHTFGQMGKNAQIAEVEKIRLAFLPWYEAGKAMAQAYIDGGPAEGNVQMGSFDEQAERLQAVLEPFLAAQMKSADGLLTEVADDVDSFNHVLISISIFAVILVVILALFISRRLSQPINIIVDIIKSMADGDLTTRSHLADRADEIGNMSYNVNRLAENLAGNIRTINLQAANISAFVGEIVTLRTGLGENNRSLTAIAAQVYDENQTLTGQITEIRGNVSQAVQNLDELFAAFQDVSAGVSTIAGGAEEANANVSAMAQSAQNMLGDVGDVNTRMGQMNGAAQLVSSSAREVQQSLQGVRQRCQAAAAESQQANGLARSAADVMTRLSDSAREIDKVVEIINDIAEQTNMLALNASIEAAGAGEAGKGFAVVANEVKGLASQTAEATRTIWRQIDEIRSLVGSAEENTREIRGAVGRIASANEEINQAVDEQGHATDEIVSSSTSLTSSSEQVLGSMVSLQSAAEEVARAADEAAKGAHEIATSTERIAASNTQMESKAKEAVDATNAIQRVVEETNQVAERVRGRVEETQSVVTAMRGSVQMFNALSLVATEVSDALYAAQSRIDVGKEPYDVRKIKSTVLAMMAQVNKAVTLMNPAMASRVADPNCCSLAKWLTEEAPEEMRALPLFQKMLETAGQFRKTAAEIVQMIHSGDQAAIESAMRFFQELRSTFFDQLDQLYIGRTQDKHALAPAMRWRDSLSVGVAQMDVDHKQLVEIINELHATLEHKLGQSVIRELLEKLVNYTATHFKREERLMEEHNYPQLDSQKASHVKFIAYVQEQLGVLDKGGVDESQLLHLFKFLQDWLVKHIQHEDMEYKPFFADLGVN